MKKSLIALAALAATASFAQSTVTISGVMDYAFINQSGTVAGIKGQTVATNIGTSSTSVIRFISVEDLGGGLRATAQYNFDPRNISNDGATSLGRDEVFMGLSGGFGNIRLGSPNSITLAAWGTASPLGTGIGSGYTGLENTFTAAPRYNRSVRYDSPRFNGITFSALHAPGNDNAVTPAQASNGIPNSRPITEIGLAYNQGALNVALAHRIVDATDYAATTFEVASTSGANRFAANAANAASAGKKSTWTSLAANYKIGATTLYAAMNDGQISAAAATDTKGSRFAVRHDIGAIALIGQYSTQKTSGVESKVTGLRGDYALSKRTAAYVGYENYDFGTTERKITSVGLRHNF